jgi:glycosyl hydrolase family 26
LPRSILRPTPSPLHALVLTVCLGGCGGTTMGSTSGDGSAPGGGDPGGSTDAATGGTGGTDGGTDGGGHDGGGTDGGTGPSASARDQVLAFLHGIQGKRAAIGIEDKDWSHPTGDSDRMAALGGNVGYPSFWSGDWGFGANLPSAREAVVQEGIRQWRAGALVQYIYHACPPTMGANESCGYDVGDTPAGAQPIKGTHLTDDQWNDLVATGGKLNAVWLARLDLLAKYFGELEAAGVAPLFRPLHEINGDWAWWQNKGAPTKSARLFQITHDYLTQVKGLRSIIWVWNVQDYSTLAGDVGKYTPGADYFDVAALDVYNTGFTKGNYDAMVGIAGGKPIGIGECYYMPGSDLLDQQPLWTYLAMWPDKLGEGANGPNLPALFKSDRIIKRAQMPGWR